MQKFCKMLTLVRVLTKPRAATWVPSLRTRWQCSLCIESQDAAAATSSKSNQDGAVVTRRRGRRRRRAVDNSIFAKFELPEAEKMTADEIEKYLLENKVYDEDGIIAFSKPAGIPVTGSRHDALNVLDVIPRLVELVGKPAAEVAKAADRDSSGLILFGENKQEAKALEDAFLGASRRNQLIRKYWALTVGIPSPSQGTIDLPLGPEEIGEHILMVPRRKVTKGSFERKESFRCRTEYRVLSTNQDLNCSLLELQTPKLKKDQFRVHLCEKNCSILGERMYAGRVREILGVPVMVDPYRATVGEQILPDAVQKTLGLRSWHLERLPLFLHWYQVTLPKWRGKRNVRITAPPPGYFTEALQRLGLLETPSQNDVIKNITGQKNIVGGTIISKLENRVQIQFKSCTSH